MDTRRKQKVSKVNSGRHEGFRKNPRRALYSKSVLSPLLSTGRAACSYSTVKMALLLPHSREPQPTHPSLLQSYTLAHSTPPLFFPSIAWGPRSPLCFTLTPHPLPALSSVHFIIPHPHSPSSFSDLYVFLSLTGKRALAIHLERITQTNIDM